jgi:hypothetical protein
MTESQAAMQEDRMRADIGEEEGKAGTEMETGRRRRRRPERQRKERERKILEWEL